MGRAESRFGGIMPFFIIDHQRMIEVKCGNAQKISGFVGSLTAVRVSSSCGFPASRPANVGSQRARA